MDNEREIKKILLSERENALVKEYNDNPKDYFLNEHRINEKNTISYIIESEFSKTKNNRNRLAFIILLAFTIISIGVTFGFSRYLENTGSRFDVNVGAFSGLNLQELIQNMQLNVRRVDMLKQIAAIKLSRMEEELGIVRKDADEQITQVLNMAVSSNEKNKRKQDILTRRDKLIEEIKIKYGSEIDSIEKEMTALATEIDKQQDKLGEQSESLVLANEITVNTPNIFETYDPTLPSQISNYYERQLSYLQNEVNNAIKMLSPEFKANDPAGMAIQNANLIEDPVKDPDKFVQTNSRNFYNILSGFKKVPYKNSVPNALVSLATYYSNITIQYDFLLKNMSDSSQQQSVITKYSANGGQAQDRRPALNIKENAYANAMEYLVRIKGEGVGYVIDGSKEKDLFIFVAKVYNLKKGNKAQIYRGEQLIADIEIISFEDNVMKASVVNLAVKGIKIMPFDSVVLVPN